jgi:hypothetical protein
LKKEHRWNNIRSAPHRAVGAYAVLVVPGRYHTASSANASSAPAQAASLLGNRVKYSSLDKNCEEIVVPGGGFAPQV